MTIKKTGILADSIHHMGMACIMNDTSYLMREISEFLRNNDINKISAEELVQLKEVSLEASMEGNAKCLDCLFLMKIPINDMCPVIAACHGHKNIIELCASWGMDCSEAWNRYFDWVLINPPNQNIEDTSVVLASEWVNRYTTQIVS